MVDFSNWQMPLQYPTGINQEHMAVRSNVGLFDVSHMGQLRIIGNQATEFLQYNTLNDPTSLKVGRGQYSMIPNQRGGLVDDIYLYRDKLDNYLMIPNAGNTAKVKNQLKLQAEKYDCHVVDETETWALLALQGP